MVASFTHGFIMTDSQRSVHQRRAFLNHIKDDGGYCSSSSSSLSMGGFGAAAASNNKKDSKQQPKKSPKLKPQQQWDRYLELKDSDKVKVAVRLIDGAAVAAVDADATKWLEVGSVKSKNNEYTEAAVIRHRILISDHSRRVFPLQISAKDSKDKLEWAYCISKGGGEEKDKDDEQEWIVAGKVDMPEDIEKMSGFEGLSDNSGFYTRSTEALTDNSVKGYANMKKKGIVGFIGMEVHD